MPEGNAASKAVTLIALGGVGAAVICIGGPYVKFYFNRIKDNALNCLDQGPECYSQIPGDTLDHYAAPPPTGMPDDLIPLGLKAKEGFDNTGQKLVTTVGQIDDYSARALNGIEKYTTPTGFVTLAAVLLGVAIIGERINHWLKH